MLKVSKQPGGSPEIFYSVQGEGVNLGTPAVFLRLSLCNLACLWCDTKYTWNWKEYDRKQQILEMTPEQVEQEILRYKCEYLVITGGEPLVQQGELIQFLRSSSRNGFEVEIETNGTIVPDPRLAELIKHWSVSPKLSNSGNAEPLREIPDCYRYFANLSNCYFKYVIEKIEDLAEVHQLVTRHGLSPDRVILMPQASSTDVLIERSKWLVNLCMSRGYRFSTRLQVLLWGNRRGV